MAASQYHLNGFNRLNAAYDSRQHAQHSTLGATWHQAGRGRFRVKAAVAWTLFGVENGRLAFKAEDAPVDVGFAQQHASIIHQVTGGKIVRAVGDDVKIFEDVEGIFRTQSRFKADYLNVW